ncbi:DUF6194 family protein [Actinoallomurus sp. CA-142502]|uniref:DUF6194 family protein n=1 Tax=Actinoallomurus sp. CA-142502 TaxID=3239885 RepID=UPI003D90204A
MESQQEIIAFVTALPGVVAETAGEETGAPEIAWGDTFFFHDPDGDTPPDRRMPFATIVTKDYDGFDTASDLNRPGVFRLNIAVGRTAFEELFGHPARSVDVDHTAVDTLMPHPVYAAQSWVAILNPGERTAEQARKLLTDAHARAVRAYQRRTARGTGSQR